MPWWSRKRRVALIGAVVLAVVLVGGGAFGLTHLGVRASGSGGGSCTPDNGKSCTFKGASAEVGFDTWDATGCVLTSVGVFASESFTHTPPGGATTPRAWSRPLASSTT